jgi:hypothetical protein
VETFTEARKFVENPQYARQRVEALSALDPTVLDAPIVDLVTAFATLRQCFTLQCCYGHFICAPGQDIHNLDPIPPDHSGPVTYRIAYFAFCLEDSAQGRALRQALEGVTRIDPGFIQFGSADWFWDRWPNSYVLQVEPRDHCGKDQAVLESREARRTERARQAFFRGLSDLLRLQSETNG